MSGSSSRNAGPSNRPQLAQGLKPAFVCGRVYVRAEARTLRGHDPTFCDQERVR